jgi:hypothetical protein
MVRLEGGDGHVLTGQFAFTAGCLRGTQHVH